MGGGKNKVFIKPLALGRMDGLRNGWRIDTYILLTNKKRNKVGYEAYEVKNKRQKLRCLLLHRKKKNIIYLFMKSLHGKFFKNGPHF